MKSPESASEATAASIDLSDDDIDDDEEIQSATSFRPSKTLLAALFILTVTFSVAGYAGFTLWSLSDHSATAEQTTAEPQEGSVTLP